MIGVDFQGRYYGSALGRFSSPDPGSAGVDITDPQSWNAYAYVGNNPLAYTDPTGMAQEDANGSCKPEDGCFSVVKTVHLSWWEKLKSWFSGGGMAATIRPGNPMQYRRAWEKANPGQQFPKDASGNNLDADHDIPISEGGDPLDGNNITPRTRADHIARHKAEGHYKKWGRQGASARAQARAGSPQSQAPGEVPELPPAPRPFVPGLDPDPVALPVPGFPTGEPGVPEPTEIPDIPMLPPGW
jgi:uncharacterized protein RhaS with RHS repeats